MPAGLTVPTIFTAVDKLSATVSKMAKNVGGFTKQAAYGISRLNSKFNNFFKLSDLSKQFLSLASTAAIAAGIIAGIHFSVKSLLDYEQNVANLHALLNNLTTQAFVPYQKEIDKVAKATEYSAVNVAESFTKIAERNIALAKTPASLAAVSEAAITLSRAAKIELEPATDALVNVLYQFGLQGKDASRVINVLAAGMVKGSSTIENQIEAYKKFAVTAKGANVTLEQSNALVQTVAHQVQGSDAGTALRNIILNLEKYKNAYKGGKFDIGYALEQTEKRFKSLGTEQKQNVFLQELFGKRTVNVARQLLNNIPLFQRLTKEITGTNEAQALAAINTDTVRGSLQKLEADWVNYITSSDNSMTGLKKVREILAYIRANFDDIVNGIVTFVKWFAILKVSVWAINAAIWTYNLYTKLMAIYTASAATAMEGQAIATAAAGTQLSLFATEAGVAEVAAAGLFATLSAFVLPAALVALGAYLTFSDKHSARTPQQRAQDDFLNKRQSDMNAATNAYASTIPIANTLQGIISRNTKINTFQSGLLQKNNFLNDKSFESMINKNSFDSSTPQKAAYVAPALQAQILHSTSTSQNNLSIDINDKGGNVSKTQMTGPLPIPVKLSSTVGPQN